MNRNSIIGALAVMLAAAALSAGEMRTWNLKSGASMRAEIVAFPSPETVEVKRSDGKLYTLPTTYLADEDRTYLDAERAKQWKQVEVNKLLGTASAGRYKKCLVGGKDVSGEILIAGLPSQVEALLDKRGQQESQITNLNSRIQEDGVIVRKESAAAASSTSRVYRNEQKAQAKLTTRDEAQAKTSLTKLKADYAESVKKTRSATTVLMKNTGLIYQGLPVWECQNSTRKQ